ncbi:MAG: hypothetical protein DDT30_01431 [Dehalococcoidia bacterium]|nr:hypothetical protein [Bacillota bacterium]MBT9142929.1 hypothetical protein [Bacillota bacterium]
MAEEKGKKYFVPGGAVPEGKDGNLVWCEEHPKAGLVCGIGISKCRVQIEKYKRKIS